MLTLDATMLRKLLEYDPETGLFTNLIRRGPRSLEGTIAGSLMCNGYIELMLNGSHYKASRLAWLYMTGEWPKYEIDHINRIRHDNRWDNLRDVSHKDNLTNRGGKFIIVEVEG